MLIYTFLYIVDLLRHISWKIFSGHGVPFAFFFHNRESIFLIIENQFFFLNWALVFLSCHWTWILFTETNLVIVHWCFCSYVIYTGCSCVQQSYNILLKADIYVCNENVTKYIKRAITTVKGACNQGDLNIFPQRISR